MPGGRPTDYREHFHPKEIMRLGRLGYFAVEVADEWDTSVQTLQDWCNLHPEFALAYARAKQYRAAWLLRQSKEGMFQEKGSTFNTQVMGMMLKYDGIQLDERYIKMPELAKAETFAEQSRVIVDAFSRGDITAKEANQVADIISKSAKIDEVTELRRMLEEIDAARKAGV